MSAANSYDAYTPAEIARRVEGAGIAKAKLALLPLVTLALLAGAFIAFGGMLYTLVMTEPTLGLGLMRWIGGIAFSLGLILVVVGGAELFTGNSLLVIACADGKVGVPALLRNWVVVYVGNFVGSVATAAMVWWSGTLMLGGGAVAETAVRFAEAKVALPFTEALMRGVLCNVLVCLAVWLAFSAHSAGGKILAVMFPIAAFVALGFEHSVANMYLIPIGMLAGADVGIAGLAANLVPVTIGNVIGGGVFVALVYWIIYVRGSGPAL